MLGLGTLAKKVFGTPNDRKIKATRPLIEKINALEPEFEKLSDEGLIAKTEELRKRALDGESLDDLLPEAFANVREGAKRALGLRAFDVQLMGGAFLPSEAFNEVPLWRNFFENEALTQFNHRMLAYAILGLAIWAFVKARKSALSAIRANFKWVLIFVAAQAVLGIVTVINAAPLSIAIFHQLGAILLWVILLRARFEVYYPGAQSLRS